MFYITMLYFHFLHKFLLHITSKFSGFPMTSLTGDPAALFFSQLQYRPSVKHKSLTRDSRIIKLLWPHQPVEIVTFPDWPVLEYTLFIIEHPAVCQAKRCCILMLLGKVDKRKIGFCSFASGLMMY